MERQTLFPSYFAPSHKLEVFFALQIQLYLVASNNKLGCFSLLFHLAKVQAEIACHFILHALTHAFIETNIKFKCYIRLSCVCFQRNVAQAILTMNNKKLNKMLYVN